MRLSLLNMLSVGLLASFVGGSASAQSGSGDGWRRHTDAAGTEVDVPTMTFTKEAGPSNLGTGKRFTTDDGRAELSIYVIANEERRSPSSYLKEKMTDRPSRLDYLRVAHNFFAVSKYDGDAILYRRCNFGSRRSRNIHCIDLSYPAGEKRAWDAPVTRVSRSLRPLE